MSKFKLTKNWNGHFKNDIVNVRDVFDDWMTEQGFKKVTEPKKPVVKPENKAVQPKYKKKNAGK